MSVAIPFFSFKQRNEDIRENAIRAFKEFFDSGWYVLGRYTEEFEKDYANLSGTKFCVGVSSGLDALHLSLLSLGIGEGDEVIVPSNTYIATVLAITYVGAKPVFVEPRWETCNINPNGILSKLTTKTKAIMPVHLYGQACEMDPIMKIAKEHSLYVIEDNAQAQGAMSNNKLTGSFGDLNATSFYPTKNLGALGEAGAITTDDKLLADKVKSLRNYGSSVTYYNDYIGYNDRIDEFEAAFLCESMKLFDEWTKKRIEIDSMYRSKLSNIKELYLTDIADNSTTVNHLFTIRSSKRDNLQKFLSDSGIGTKIHYPLPPHLQKCYKNLNYKEGDFPIAEKIANQTLSLPNFIGLTEKEIDYIAIAIKRFFLK